MNKTVKSLERTCGISQKSQCISRDASVVHLMCATNGGKRQSALVHVLKLKRQFNLYPVRKDVRHYKTRTDLCQLTLEVSLSKLEKCSCPMQCRRDEVTAHRL